MTKTQKRTEWARKHKNAIIASRTKVIVPVRAKGHNAATIQGMSSGGYGWWANALIAADINCDKLPYWSGSNPTPSTAINKGIADYIDNNAADLR